MTVVYGEDTPSYATAKCWATEFRRESKSLEDWAAFGTSIWSCLSRKLICCWKYYSAKSSSHCAADTVSMSTGFINTIAFVISDSMWARRLQLSWFLQWWFQDWIIAMQHWLAIVWITQLLHHYNVFGTRRLAWSLSWAVAKYFTACLLQLHWLPVCWFIQFSLCCVMYPVFCGPHPPYLTKTI